MAIDISIIQADRQAIIADLPTSVAITRDGVSVGTFSGRKSNNTKSLKYGSFGAIQGYKMSLSLYTTTPILEGDRVTISSVVYRVLEVDPGSIAGNQTLHLGSEYDGG